MKTRTVNFIASPAICFLLIISYFNLSAQDTTSYALPTSTFSKSHVFIGSQIPVQFTAGYGYQLSNRLSARAQAGFITKPYSGFIVDALEAFGLDKYLGRVIKKAFKSGSVFSIGPDYHFGKNYIGIYGQYIHLKGGGVTPADALSVYFKKDFTGFDITSLPLFEFNMQSDIINAGALFGRRFQLRNPQFSINGEIGLSKMVASKNSFSSNRTIIDGTVLARNLYKELDNEMRDAYWKHGFIPTINLYLVYQFQ
jgi:hypothetical protein